MTQVFNGSKVQQGLEEAMPRHEQVVRCVDNQFQTLRREVFRIDSEYERIEQVLKDARSAIDFIFRDLQVVSKSLKLVNAAANVLREPL